MVLYRPNEEGPHHRGRQRHRRTSSSTDICSYNEQSLTTGTNIYRISEYPDAIFHRGGELSGYCEGRAMGTLQTQGPSGQTGIFLTLQHFSPTFLGTAAGDQNV